jgi:hypothetical protein
MQSSYSEGFEEIPLVRAEPHGMIIALNMWNNMKSGGSHKESPSGRDAAVIRILHGTRVRFSSGS